MNDAALKVLFSPELLEAFSTRDADGNRLSVEVGEPDAEGFYTPVITRHYDDNLVAPYRAVVAEAWNALAAAESDPECPGDFPTLRAALENTETRS